MEPSGERKLSAVPSVAEEDAAWRFLDAVWDVPVGLGLCDTDLHFVRVNEALAGFDGLSVDAHYENEETLGRLPAAFAEGLRQAASGEAHDVEFTSSGRCVLVKLHPVLRPSDRMAIGVGIVALDVTDERNAFRAVEEANRLIGDLLADATAKEQALSRLIESVQEGLLVVEPTGRMKLVNQAAERILGHTREALVGAQFQDERWWCADGSGNRDAAALLARAVEQPELFHGELCVETDQGRAPLMADATSLRDTQGNVEEVVVSLRDVTGERHDLAVARSNLEFQQQIIGIVGHDLRNPLATITASIGLLRRQEGLTRASVESLDRVARSAARVVLVGAQLVGVQRQPEERGEEDAPGGPRRAAELPAEQGGIGVVADTGEITTIDVSGANPISGVTSADVTTVQNILKSNYGYDPLNYGGTAPVRVQSIASAAHIVEIKVHNGGAVIPADVLPELFKAYRRGIRGESTGREPGLGLGLFIVAQIAAAHGGRASAESSAESGTTFTIQLPRSVARRGP